MGTLNREKREYSWSAGGVNYVVSQVLGPLGGIHDELYRLACDVEALAKYVRRDSAELAAFRETEVSYRRQIANQNATIVGLREQLLAANEKVGKAAWKIMGQGAMEELEAALKQKNRDERLDNHESRLSLHEARLDAMEEVFDKIKDIL